MFGVGSDDCNVGDYEQLSLLYHELRDLGLPTIDSPCLERFPFPASPLDDLMTGNGSVECSTVNFEDVNSNWIYDLIG